MARTSDPYSRVYWRIVDDPRFEEVYGDDRLLASWLRLLLIADQAWPASAHLPASVRGKSLETLVRVGLLEVRTGGIYRIHGLDAERERRQSAASASAMARWDADAMRSHNGRNAKTMLEETRRDEKRKGLRDLLPQNARAGSGLVDPGRADA